MNADHEEAVEFAKISKRENRVYVGNLSYDVKYRDLMEFMRGGGWGNLSSVFSSKRVWQQRRAGRLWSFFSNYARPCERCSNELELWLVARISLFFSVF
jgi:hypothetical protein